MRIFMGFTEIAGFYKHLKLGFQEKGFKCTFVDLNGSRFQYNGDDTPNLLIKWLKWLYKRNSRSFTDKILKQLWWPSKALVFLWALFNYDVFIFGYNSSLLRFYDFPILKFFGKKIICQFHGSDSRPAYIDGAIMASGLVNIEQCIKMTYQKKQIIKKIDKYADIIINSPTQGHFHERPFVLWPFVGLPYEDIAKGHSPSRKYDNNNEIRIVHAPSAPEAKGTKEINKIIDKLKNKGYKISFLQIIGRPNSEVLDELAECDFVVDQLYSDCHMPGLATEAACFGKPTVVGSYAIDVWQNLIPQNKIPPTYFCHPDEFEEAVEKLINDEQYRSELGNRANKFVRTEWSVAKVIESYLRLIKGDIPENWMYKPDNIQYFHGLGLPEDRVKAIIREVIEQGGIEALQLSDKPELEKFFKEFAYS